MHVPTDKPLREWIVELIRCGKEYKFYKTVEWYELRDAVMSDHHNECEMCEAKGLYRKAVTVHHEYELKDYPELALTRFLEQPDGTMKEILHPLCAMHHNKEHERFQGCRKQDRRIPLNEERW